MKMPKAATAEELATIMHDVRTRPVVPLIPHVAVLRGIGKNLVYDAVKRGEIDVIRTGRRINAISASLRRELGIEMK